MTDPDSAQDPLRRAIDATRASLDDPGFERGPEHLRSQFAALWASAGAATAVSGLASEAAAESASGPAGAELLEQARLDAISSAEHDALLRRGADLPDLPVNTAQAAGAGAGAKVLWIAAATGSALGLTGALLFTEPAPQNLPEPSTAEPLHQPPLQSPLQPKAESAPEPTRPTPAIEPPAREPEALDRPLALAPAQPDRAEQPRRRRHRALDLGDLDRQARQAWRAGELRRAIKLFRTILRRSPGSHWAHMAYADLFTIHRRLGEQRALRELWRSYIKQFPQGRHAEDARAGLCRTQRTAKRCWQDYLDRHPEGSYAGQAQRALEGGGEQ